MVLYRFKPVESWTRLQEAIISGHAYMIGHRFESLSAGGSSEILLYVTEQSKDVYICDIDLATSSECFLDIYVNSDVTDYGTEIQSFNLNLNFPNESVTRVYYDGTYSGGQLMYSSVIPGGSRKNALGYAVSAGAGITLSGGNNIRIRIYNPTNATNDVSINILWIEESG